MSISGNALTAGKRSIPSITLSMETSPKCRVFIQNILIEMFVGFILFEEDSKDLFKPILTSFTNKAEN